MKQPFSVSKLRFLNNFLILVGIASLLIISLNTKNDSVKNNFQSGFSLINREFISNQDTDTGIVLICVSSDAYAYHKYQCWGLKKCTYKIEKVTVKEAKKRGYKSCNICYKDIDKTGVQFKPRD